MELTEKQKLAIATAVECRVCVITGGAGSGKTTVIKNIYEALQEAGHHVLLAAPTGKAAARIREATGFPASTVHSACGFFPSGEELAKLPRKPPAALCTAFIIDEASMTDDSLLAGVCSTISPDCKLILVGDPNQLPPVGAGYPFRDLSRSNNVPHVHLDVCHRQDGRLLANCYSILEGKSEELIYDSGKGNRADAEWGFIECGDDSIGAALAHLYTGDNCENSLGVKAEELLVLTPLNDRTNGRIHLNRLIQSAYHTSRGRVAPTYNEPLKGNDRFVEGDRVIWGQNDKALGLVNGDTGTVKWVDNKQALVAWDGIGDIKVSLGPELRLAWALTCHKAQGSQYAKVLVVQAKAHSTGHLRGIVNRSWVYTAATRSKKSTFFIGSAAAFNGSVRAKAVDSRETYLQLLV